MKAYYQLQKTFSSAVIILLLIWISFFSAPIHQRYQLFTNVFLSAAFLVLLIKNRTAIFNRKDLPLWLFLIALGLNVNFAQDRNTALKTYLDLAIPLLAVYYFAKAGVSTNKNFKIISIAIASLSGLVILMGIFEVCFKFNPLYEYLVPNEYYKRYISGILVRPMSFQFNPAVLGSYLLFALPFNLLWLKNDRRFIRWLAWTGIILNAAVCLLTFSRGTLLGLMAITIFYLAIQKSYRLIIISLIGLVILITVCSCLPYPFSKFSWDSTLGQEGALASYRIDRFIMTQRIIKEHPFIGLGFQHFRSRFFEFYPGRDKVIYEKRIADNMYLTILAETGIVGFCGFGIFIFSLFKPGFYRLKRALSSQDKEALIAVIASLIGLLVSAAGYELFYWPSPFFIFCILSGMLAGLSFGKS